MLLRFRLGPIPVEIHPSHLLLVAILGMSYSRSTGGLVVWMALISFSVLFHELGHATVSRAFGYAPAIQLAGLGGNTRPNAPAPIPWHRDVLLTLAGPLFGLLLAGGCYVAQSQLHEREAFHNLLVQLGWTNVAWSVLNLIPVLPMDGGRITHAVMTRIFGSRGGLITWGISAVLAGGMAILAAVLHNTMGALLFGMFALQAGRALHGLWEGGRSGGDPPALLEARTLFDRGAYDDAGRAAAQVAEAATTPAIRSRAEHLLGWVSLKQGKGRAALDHFSQVSRQRVEREALAAAFSLIGDDVRALPLWELGYREGPNRTLLHEWAGTLIRLNRDGELGRLPALDLALAYTCAERVWFLRGDFKDAATAGAKAFEHAPTARGAYDIACAYARAGLSTDAVAWLHRATGQGFTDVAQAQKDPDLASLHGRADFESWRVNVT